MSTQCEVVASQQSGSKISFFERYLTLWVFLCIIAGVALGHWLPEPFQMLGRLEALHVDPQLRPAGVSKWPGSTCRSPC